MASSGMNINRIAPWRFLLFFAVLIAAWIIAIGAGAVFSRGLLIGFDVAAMFIDAVELKLIEDTRETH